MSKLKNWKNAASLLITCRPILNPSHKPLGPNIISLNNDKEDYKILMMERNVNSPFMPSKSVFPGGVLSEADSQGDWKMMFEDVAKSDYHKFLEKLASSGTGYPMQEENVKPLPANIIFRICAIRETFEETGLLLVVNKETIDKNSGKSSIHPHQGENNNKLLENNENLYRGVGDEVQKEAQTWRKKVSEDAGQFIKMCASMQVVPDVWSLYEWNNWLTPFFKKKSSRYDTLFYLCCLQSQQLPVVQADNFESTKLDWLEPSLFLKQLPEGGYKQTVLAPPQSYELTDLINFATLDALQQEAKNRTFQKRLRTRLWPALGICKDEMITILPGDRLYDDWIATESIFDREDCSFDNFDKTTGPLHRIIYNRRYPNGKIIIES